MISVLAITLYIIDKTWREYEPMITANFAVNLRLLMSKTAVNIGCFNIVAYTKQQLPTYHVDNG